MKVLSHFLDSKRMLKAWLNCYDSNIRIDNAFLNGNPHGVVQCLKLKNRLLPSNSIGLLLFG